MSVFLQTLSHILKMNLNHDAKGEFASGPGGVAVELETPGWKQISEKKGSNPGGLHEAPDGTHTYVKFYANPDQARTEVASSKVFEAMEVPTAKPRIETVNGKTALVTQWNDQLQQLKPGDFSKLNMKQSATAAKAYVAAVLTKNWDVVGLEHDNLVLDKTTGNLMEVDTGGSFKYRAQGESKPFGADIDEATSLMNTKFPAGQVFDHIAKNQPLAMKAAYKALKSMDIDKVVDRIAASGIKDGAEIATNVIKRRNSMLDEMSKYA